jgi:hypothetical protein
MWAKQAVLPQSPLRDRANQNAISEKEREKAQDEDN